MEAAAEEDYYDAPELIDLIDLGSECAVVFGPNLIFVDLVAFAKFIVSPTVSYLDAWTWADQYCTDRYLLYKDIL